MLKIYFAGAIRGGRDDATLYTQMISHLQKYGEVLTTHVGDPDLLRQEKSMTEQEIYGRDMQWMEDADLLIAEVTTPSLGVGYEIAMARTMGKDIFCLYRKAEGKELSAMIAGNPHLKVFNYGDEEQARQCFEQIFSEFI
ncbi:MAG: nucleoside 2-deoxyribosyltransferase [Desulfobulbaceae bacterium]|nr:nucleoside 2-deoxyribosyltransferase [Desulfobulbaceae bacterium]